MGGEFSPQHVAAITPDRFFHDLLKLRVASHKTRAHTGTDPENILQHENLPVCSGAGTDPDRRAWDRLRNSGGQRRRNALQHYREHSQPVQRFGVIQDRFRFFGGFPVNVELASGTLWQQP